MAEKANPRFKLASSSRQPSMEVVYGVHAVRPREICATRFVTGDVAAAERYAAAMSQDPGVLAAGVTRYVMDTEGQRRAEALYVAGKRQQVPYISDDRQINANGCGGASAYAPRFVAAQDKPRDRDSM